MHPSTREVPLVMQANRATPSLIFGCLALAALAVTAPLAVSALLPPTVSRETIVGAVIVTEMIVLLAILAVWFYLRSARAR